MVDYEYMTNWYGWFIEQSFDEQSIFSKFKTVKMKSEDKDWKEHIVEIPNQELDKAIKWLKSHLKPAWYAHLVNGDEIVVVYYDKSFRSTKGEPFEEIREFGRAQGIIEEQLPSDKLFELARKSGY